MSNKKRTATEWLIANVKSADWQDMFIWHKEDVFRQAKAIEKEQAFEIFKAGQNSMEEGGKSFEQYYEQ